MNSDEMIDFFEYCKDVDNGKYICFLCSRNEPGLHDNCRNRLTNNHFNCKYRIKLKGINKRQAVELNREIAKDKQMQKLFRSGDEYDRVILEKRISDKPKPSKRRLVR